MIYIHILYLYLYIFISSMILDDTVSQINGANLIQSN